MVVDLLSQKSFMLGACQVIRLQALFEEFAKLTLKAEPYDKTIVVTHIRLQVSVWDEIKQVTAQEGIWNNG